MKNNFGHNDLITRWIGLCDVLKHPFLRVDSVVAYSLVLVYLVNS